MGKGAIVRTRDTQSWVQLVEVLDSALTRARQPLLRFHSQEQLLYVFLQRYSISKFFELPPCLVPLLPKLICSICLLKNLLLISYLLAKGRKASFSQERLDFTCGAKAIEWFCFLRCCLVFVKQRQLERFPNWRSLGQVWTWDFLHIKHEVLSVFKNCS